MVLKKAYVREYSRFQTECIKGDRAKVLEGDIGAWDTAGDQFGGDHHRTFTDVGKRKIPSIRHKSRIE